MKKSSIRIILSLTTAIFLIGCINNKSSSAVTATDERSKLTYSLIEAAARAYAKSNVQPLAELWDLSLNEWDKSDRRSFAQGLKDVNVNVRTISAMSFFVYAGDLSQRETVNLWNQTETDAVVRSSLIVSVYMSKGFFMREKDRVIPLSSLLMEKMIQEDIEKLRKR